MRLTDLLRNNDGKKKPASSIFSKSGEQSPQQETAKSFPGKGDKKAVHLQADDLAALYNINIPEDTSSTSPSTGQEPDTPRETEQKTDIPVDVHENEQTDADVSDEETYKEAPREIEEERKVDIRNDVSANTAPKKPVGGEDGFDDKLERESADAIHIELLDALDDVYEEGKTGKEIYTERLIPPINRLIELCKHSNAILRKAIRLKKGGKSFTTHSLNLAILAAKIGLVRNYPYERVFSLTLCALLGDIGMTRVDPAILNKSGKLTPEEFQEIKNHINYSVEVVRGVSRKFPFLAPIIYQVHERENGSGYPDSLKGDNIHEFAKIIGLCDVYIALSESKRSRENYSGYVALQQIISRRGIDFEAGIIKSLIDVISVFPLESLVRLNNGAIGRVIEISRIHPTRPKLNILVNSDGEKLKRPAFLDLEKEPLLYIEGPDIEEGAIL